MRLGNGARFRTGSTWETMPTVGSSSSVNPSMTGIADQSYDSELRGSYSLRSWTRLSIMTASQAVAPRLPWKDRNHLSTQLSPNTPWPCWRVCSDTGRFVTTVVSSTSRRAWAVVCRLMPLYGGDSAGAARVNGAGHEALPQRHVLSRLLRLSIKCDVPTKLNCPLPHGFCAMGLGAFPSRTHGIRGMPWLPRIDCPGPT
jgi:hypothetical protein